MTDDSNNPDSSGAGAQKPVGRGESRTSRRAAAPQQRTEADLRKARAAQKLKENLQRRKQQQRSRRAGLADEAEGLPAAVAAISSENE